MNCPCCGGKMETNEKEKVTIFKCNNCGLSNTELKGAAS
ncbi:MAG TPA: zf-TFIIB domain-containing protein [Nitrososphaeraceae archaeon]|nr:zf-TFIIB domain-containing protein [Nitrososphaeraceae archaeon]